MAGVIVMRAHVHMCVCVEWHGCESSQGVYVGETGPVCMHLRARAGVSCRLSPPAFLWVEPTFWGVEGKH